jgi:ectoine hydroxylase-related dioxygenase (phytanoyl-CoA dioxygenase family)
MPCPRFRFTGAVQRRERAFYEEHGFIVYREFLTRTEIDRLSADADAYQESIRAGNVPPAHVDTVAPVTRDADGSVKFHHRLNYFTRHSHTAAELACSPRMEAIRTGIGGDAYWLLEEGMNGAVWQLKSGGARSGYSRIRWHLDFPLDHPLSPAFTAGLYLDDSIRATGCLAVVPGSHRFPVGLVPPEPLYVEVAAGDLVCHHERIFHGSEGMSRPTDRRATVYLYYCAGSRPAAGQPYADPGDLSAVQSLFLGAAGATR